MIDSDYNILKKNILQKITCQVLRVLDSRYPKLFSNLDAHVDIENLQSFYSHRVNMIKRK